MTGLREWFGDGGGLRERFSAAVPVQDQWVEVGVFLVNTRTGERKLNNRNGGLPTIDTPTATMAAPQPREPSLLRIPEPVRQPRSSHSPEDSFQTWYRASAVPAGLDPNPDDPRHRYDYRAAYAAGAQPELDPTSGETHWPSQFKADDHPNRFVGIIDTKYGQPRAIPGGLPTNAPMEDDRLGSVDVSAPSARERLAASVASNAFGPFIGAAEVIGGWAERTGLDALFPGAETPHGMREALRERSDALLEQELLANPEGGFLRALDLTASEIATGLPGPSLVLGPAAGSAGGMIARTAGLGRTGQVLSAMGAGAAEQGLENFGDTVDRPWQERAASVAMGAGLGLLGDVGSLRRPGVSAGLGDTAGRAVAVEPLGLREHFARAKQARQTEALASAGWRFEEQPDGTVVMTKPEDAGPSPTIEIGEDGRPRPTAYGKEVLSSQEGFPPDLDPWISKTTGEDPDRLTYREKLDYYGQMVAEEKAAHATWLEEGPPAQEPIPELTPERWLELKAKSGKTRALVPELAGSEAPTTSAALSPEDAAPPDYAVRRDGSRVLVTTPMGQERVFGSSGEASLWLDGENERLFNEWDQDERIAEQHRSIPAEPFHFENRSTYSPEILAEWMDESLRRRGFAEEPAPPPSPLATGLWERFQSRRPTALTAPFEQRLAAAAYDRGLIKTQDELSGLLAEAPQFAPAAAGRVATDAAIRDALEALRARPQTGPIAAPTAPSIKSSEAELIRIDANWTPEQRAVAEAFSRSLNQDAQRGLTGTTGTPEWQARLAAAGIDSHDALAGLSGAARRPVGKPSEAGFIRIRSEPPLPDTPEGAAMDNFIGDVNLPPMTMAERFDSLRQGAQSFYTEMVNLDAPAERLGKRKGAPAGMKRTVELQLQKVRGAGDIAKNMAESRNDVESLWSIWNGADEATYRDWRRIGAAEREMELIERVDAGDEIDIDQNAADVARNYLDNVAPQLRTENPRLDRLITETRRWSRDNIIEPFVEAGILSRAQADEIVAKNQAHLPFNRVQRAVETMAAGTQDEMARAKVHRITAGLSEIDKIREPMESILQRAHHARVIAEQQKVRNVLAGFVEMAPDVFPEIGKAETKAVPVAVVDDKTIFRRKNTKTKKTEAFPVWRDGEMEVWEAPSDVLNTINFLGPHELSGGLKAIHSALSVPGHMMRAGVTSTLEFALYRNPAFDQFEAFINSKAGFVPVLDTLRGLFHVAGKTKLWDDAMRAGAGNSVLVAMDRPETVTRISSVMQEQGLAGSIKSALDAWKDSVFPASGKILGIPGAVLGRAPGARGFAPTRIALTPLQAASQVMESPTRMGGYLAAEKPMPWNRAVRRAENLLVPASQRVGMGPLGPELAMEEFRSNTLDFLRGGRTGKLLNGPEAFLNAEIQGWDKFARNLKYRPGPTLLKAIAAFTIPALAHWEMNHDDEDYRREPEWKKMLFFRMPLPNGTSVPVPRGRGLASTIFGYMIEKVLDHAAETDPDAARDVVAALVDNTPAHYGIDVRRGGGVMPSLDLIPTAAEPEVEIATNYDAFRDAPVEPRGKTSLLPADRFSASTSPTLQALSDATPFSPIQVQHLVRGHLGGVGQYATDFADQFVDSEFQELPPDNQLPAPLDWVPTDAPLIKGMVSREPVGFGSRPVQDFYAILERATQARNSFKAADEAGRYERADEIVAEYPEMDWAEDLERASKELGEIRKEWNEIRALPPDAATPEEIREWLHELDVEATLTAEDILRSIGVMK